MWFYVLLIYRGNNKYIWKYIYKLHKRTQITNEKIHNADKKNGFKKIVMRLHRGYKALDELAPNYTRKL